MEMADYILSILRTNLMVVFSWGFYDPVALEDGLEFKVNGYKHQGLVRVKYIDWLDLFEVTLLNADGSVKEQAKEVYFDTLVETIDDMVEMVPNYRDRVEEQYGINA